MLGERPDFINLAGSSDGPGGCVATLSDHAAAARTGRVKAIQAEQMKIVKPLNPEAQLRPIVDFGCYAHKVDNVAKEAFASFSKFHWPPGSQPISLPNMPQVRDNEGACASGGAVTTLALIDLSRESTGPI
jgi:hypothetical protein